MENNDYYLKIGRASELKDPRERRIYRFFEILPGALSWMTFIILIILSFALPVWVAFFVIAFDIYWLLKTMYLSLHLRSAHKKMLANLKINWREKLEASNIPWKEMYHLIILPMYDEEKEIVTSSLRALTQDNYPQNRMIVALAIEERAGNSAAEIAKAAEKEFSNKFFKFLITTHPKDLPSEVAGKGSNSAWAGREAKKIIDQEKISYQNIIVSTFDIDTVITPGYFSCLTFHYITNDKPQNTSFQPIPFFTNNIWQAPALARTIAFSSTFWHMLQQERPERSTTFSSHSMSFQTLVEVDFWQTNVISEDSRIFWQCFFYKNGDYRVMPLYFPVSMDANAAPTFWQTLKNQYRQQKRWGYGAENIPYFLFGFLKNKKIGLGKKLRWSFVVIESFHSWATNALIIFVFGWLPLVIGGSNFNTTVLAKNLPFLTREIMTSAMIGLVFSAILSIGLLPPRPKKYGRVRYFWMIIQWILLPITIIIFGSFPGLDAQTRLILGKYMGFWTTPKYREL